MNFRSTLLIIITSAKTLLTFTIIRIKIIIANLFLLVKTNAVMVFRNTVSSIICTNAGMSFSRTLNLLPIHLIFVFVNTYANVS